MQVWDVASNPGARKAFGERIKRHGRELGEIKKGGGIVGIADDDEDDEDEQGWPVTAGTKSCSRTSWII